MYFQERDRIEGEAMRATNAFRRARADEPSQPLMQRHDVPCWGRLGGE